jgi:hypothetical protein
MRKLGIAVAVFMLAFGWCVAASAATVQLKPVDNSGVYAIPPGVRVQDILLDGESALFVLVKGGTEVDVPKARPGCVVEAVIAE